GRTQPHRTHDVIAAKRFDNVVPQLIHLLRLPGIGALIGRDGQLAIRHAQQLVQIGFIDIDDHATSLWPGAQAVTCVVCSGTLALAGGCQPRTSILPVTAAEIRAERRSWSNSKLRLVSDISDTISNSPLSLKEIKRAYSSRGGTGRFRNFTLPQFKCGCMAPV